VDFVSYSQQLDTGSPAGRLLFDVLAAISQFERSLISERVKSGMAAAKRKGKRIGRRRVSYDKQLKARRMRADGASFREVSRKLGISVGSAATYGKKEA
jgi:DNA invertase Pin-like site-specific DNA recombinase